MKKIIYISPIFLLLFTAISLFAVFYFLIFFYSNIFGGVDLRDICSVKIHPFTTLLKDMIELYKTLSTLFIYMSSTIVSIIFIGTLYIYLQMVNLNSTLTKSDDDDKDSIYKILSIVFFLIILALSNMGVAAMILFLLICFIGSFLNIRQNILRKYYKSNETVIVNLDKVSIHGANSERRKKESYPEDGI